jgi:hypothetical protein
MVNPYKIIDQSIAYKYELYLNKSQFIPNFTAMRYLIVLSLILHTLLTSCNKYEEGPSISFRKALTRAANTWNFSSITINGVEQVKFTEYATQKQFWAKDGNYNHTYINPSNGVAELVTGTWELLDDARKVSIIYSDPNSGQPKVTRVYNILMLKNDEMWIRSEDNSIEAHLVTAN